MATQSGIEIVNPARTMKAYDISEIIREVRIAIDENSGAAGLESVGDMETLSLNEIIKSKIADAARIVELGAPIHLLGSGEPFATSIGWPSGKPGIGYGIISLPDNFLRLVCFQMASWTTSACEVITESDPRYLLQSSPIAGLRGNPSRPVVAITHRTEGLTLEFYSCNEPGATSVRKARYIPIPKIEGTTIYLSEKLVPAIVYQCACMTMLSLGEADIAQSLQAMSKELMQ